MTGFKSKREMAQEKTSMTKDEALKMALEALEEYHYGEALIIIHEALAQPVQRPWVGLAPAEISNFVNVVWPTEATSADYVRAIEQALKEKNNG